MNVVSKSLNSFYLMRTTFKAQWGSEIVDWVSEQQPKKEGPLGLSITHWALIHSDVSSPKKSFLGQSQALKVKIELTPSPGPLKNFDPKS